MVSSVRDTSDASAMTSAVSSRAASPAAPQPQNTEETGHDRNDTTLPEIQSVAASMPPEEDIPLTTEPPPHGPSSKKQKKEHKTAPEEAVDEEEDGDEEEEDDEAPGETAKEGTTKIRRRGHGGHGQSSFKARSGKAEKELTDLKNVPTLLPLSSHPVADFGVQDAAVLKKQWKSLKAAVKTIEEQVR